MLIHPDIDPVAVHLGPLAVHWYGLTYLAAFGLFMALGRLRLRHLPYAAIQGPSAWRYQDVEDILFLGVMGVVLGGRLGYCLFYKPEFYLFHPLEVFKVWQGGMSFHGGMLGVIVSMVWFAHSRAKPFWQVADFVAPCVPTGLAAGRVGNFAAPAPRRATPRRCTSSCWRVCCCSCCCGFMRGASVSPGRWRRPFCSVTGCFASSPSSSASRMIFWACWRSA